MAIRSDGGQFDSLAKQVALYGQIEGTEAWKDWQARLVQLRDATKQALERGTLDKWGKTHDDEQRSVLYVLDQLIAYVPGVKSDYETLIARMKGDEAAAGRPLYGTDRITTLTEDF